MNSASTRPEAKGLGEFTRGNLGKYILCTKVDGDLSKIELRYFGNRKSSCSAAQVGSHLWHEAVVCLDRRKLAPAVKEDLVRH